MGVWVSHPHSYSLPQYTSLKATRQPTIMSNILSHCAIGEVSSFCNQAHWEPIVAIVAVLPIDITAVEVQVKCARARVGCA